MVRGKCAGILSCHAAAPCVCYLIDLKHALEIAQDCLIDKKKIEFFTCIRAGKKIAEFVQRKRRYLLCRRRSPCTRCTGSAAESTLSKVQHYDLVIGSTQTVQGEPG